MSKSPLLYVVWAAGIAATAGFLALPSDTAAGTVAWSVPFVLAAAVLGARIVMSPEVRGPLRLLVAGAWVYLGASVAWYVMPVHAGAAVPFPSILDAAFFIAYGLYAGFLLVSVRSRVANPGLASRLAVTDAAILTLAMSAVLWVAAVEPYLSMEMTTFSVVVAVAYPAMQLLLFGIAARLAIADALAHRGVAMLLFVWIGGELFADVFYGVQSANGTFSYDGPLIAVWMLAYTALAGFAAHPGTVSFLRAEAHGAGAARPLRTPVRLIRFGLLLLASLIPLVLAALRGGLDLPLLVVAGATFALSFYRASLVAGDLAEQRRLAAEVKAALNGLRVQHADLARLAAAIDASRDAIIVCSPDGAVLHWNRGAEQLYGYTRGEAVGAHVGRFVPLDQEWLEATIARLEAERHIRVEVVVVRKDGSAVDVEATLSSISDAGGRSLGMVGVWRDVTERNRLRRELDAHARRLAEAQRLAGLGSFERDLITGRDVWSSEYYRILGVEEGTEASYARYLDRLHPDDRPSVEERMRLHQPGQPLEYETRVVRPDGEVRWIAVRGEVESDGEGVSVRKTGTALDITDRKAAEAELEHLTLTDTLTGLANRDGFNRLLQSALDRSDGEGVVGLLLLDLDGFKDVNDGIGHHAGDVVLNEVARRISAVLRSGDEVARLGGDEFAAVLPDIGDVGHAIEVAAAVRSSLEPAFVLDGITVHVGGSIGIAVSADRVEPGALLKRADVAMYRAKTLPSGWAVFAPDEDDLAVGRLQMVTELRATIERGDLEVAYQPILDTRSRHISAFEALARWHHPAKGLVPPDQFIPLAEQADLIVPLTRLVLRKAMAACAAWRDAGHDVRVGVNLSVQVLETEDPCTMVAEALHDTGLDAQHLVLEITEGSLATEGDHFNDVLCALRELGVRLVIDDFGTGYSAMSYLKQLPVEELKIDRSFVRDIATDNRDLAIVRSLIRLAHSLSLSVVAEGVESLPALNVLTALGCDFAQGYGIARPMPEAETAGWLTRYVAPTAARATDAQPSDLLIVDDSAAVRARLSMLASEAGWQVREAASAEQAIMEVDRTIPDVVVLDHYMTGMTGAESVPKLRARGFDGPILLFTQFLSDAMPKVRVPLDVWPVSKANPHAVMELLEGYRASTSEPSL